MRLARLSSTAAVSLVIILISAGLASRAEGQAFTPRPEHPRLFFTAERITELKGRLATDRAAAEAWAAILAEADKGLDQPASAKKNKPEEAKNHLEALSLAYRITGDKRYAEIVRDGLLREIQRPDWEEPELARRDPPWHAGLDTARSCYRAAIAFDAIHDFLSPDDRRRIAQGIVDLGILPTLNDWVLGPRRIHTLDTMGHNWWSSCVFSAGLAALAVWDEEPRAGVWLSRISSASVEWFRYAGSVIENKPGSFDPAGGFFESVNYGSFALSQYLLFRLAWTNALRTPAPAEIPLLERAGGYFLDVAYPTSDKTMTFNFGDGALHADGSRPLALLWANGYRKPDYLWYLSANRKMSYREGLDPSTPLGLVYFPTAAELEHAPATPSSSPSTLYPEIGWAMLRDSWKKDATLLGIRSGYTWNHDHADAGSFILFHAGENVLIDSGNCLYSKPEYDAYYRRSQAHNVVLFNGEAENPEDAYSGSKFAGSVSHLIESGDLRYVMADATGPTSQYFKRNYRHFLWVGDVILVIDDLQSYQPGQFEWLLHFEGKAELRGLDLEVKTGKANVLVRPLFPETFPDAGVAPDYPEKMRLTEKVGLKDHEPNTKIPYYSFSVSEQTRRTKFIVAITLVTEANKDSLPKIERITAKDLIGARIQQGGKVTEVWFNLRADGSVRHRNANTEVNGWETDAYLTAMTWADGADHTNPDSVVRTFVADGSYLRRGEKQQVLDSLSKVFVAWTVDGTTMDVHLQGQPVINATLRSPKKPTEVRVNGRRVETVFDSPSQSIAVSLP